LSKVAVVLSGCGVKDGSEIHESVLCILALSRAGHSYSFFAPDKEQAQTINHLTGKPSDEKRNILVEAARIARGKIAPLSSLDPDHFDALLLPGGFGAMAHLADDSTLISLIKSFYRMGKKIAAACISPLIIATVLGEGVRLTLGTNPGENKKLDAVGARGESCPANKAIADEKNHIYTTPCYMEEADLSEMFKGVEEMVSHL